MQLRNICQHPFLFESVEDKITPSGFIDDKLVRTPGKLELLNRVLPKFVATGHRVRLVSFLPQEQYTELNDTF
jgi:ATP-dependent helicase STH1/SNF2